MGSRIVLETYEVLFELHESHAVLGPVGGWRVCYREVS
jgi:hypothetical protein